MRVPSLQAALRWGRASEGVWRTLLNWAFESRLPRTWTLCFVCICWSSKPPPPSTASQPLSRAPLENRQNMFLMKAEPLAARGAILVHTFCLPPFSLSHTHTHTHTHTQPERLASLGPINNACAALHPAPGQERGWGERTCVTAGPCWGRVCNWHYGGRFLTCKRVWVCSDSWVSRARKQTTFTKVFLVELCPL